MSSNVSGTLHTYPDNWRAFKVLIAAKYSGANVVVSPNFVFGQTNKTADFLKKFPLGKVPAFETKDGKYITESNAIAFYVSNEQLRGKNDYDKAKVLEWCDFADGVLLPPSSKWVFPCMGITQYNKQVAESAKEEIKVALSYLNAYLLSRTYLVSERITLADIVLACTMMALYKYVLDPSFRTPYPNVNRWFVTVVNQPQFKSVAGEFKLCDKIAEFDAQKFAELQASKGSKSKSGGDSKGKGGQASKKAEQAPKKEGKAKVAAEPAEEMDEAELALAAEPKSKDPFDELPKGTFNMDDFKRCYSNEDVEVSIPYFWEKFDKENYSIWFGEYKYNNELQKVFMSCNLISGMFQRLEKMRKQAFASMCLFGKDNDSSISGIWVWRGHNLAFELSPDWKTDYDVYAWKKLSPDDPNAKKLVEQYFAWIGKDSAGRAFNQGKIFK